MRKSGGVCEPKQKRRYNYKIKGIEGVYIDQF